MDFKKMLIDKAMDSVKAMADEQAKGAEEMLIQYIQSKEVEERLAEKMDKAINIPFVSDQKEEPMFRELADIMTDILAGAIRMIRKSR
jgi:acetolactate synthase small subunit